jgi:hypothetical protein
MFTVALIGLYALFVVPRMFAAFSRREWIAASAVSIGLLLLSPLAFTAADAADDFGAQGYLWRISAALPTVAETGIAFWPLVPLGILSVYSGYVQREWAVLVYIAAFLATSIAHGVVFQKYYDPFALLAVILLAQKRGAHPVTTAVLIGLFVAYAWYQMR